MIIVIIEKKIQVTTCGRTPANENKVADARKSGRYAILIEVLYNGRSSEREVRQAKRIANITTPTCW